MTNIVFDYVYIIEMGFAFFANGLLFGVILRLLGVII